MLPSTPFSTPLSRSHRETAQRIRSIAQGKKGRPPLWLMVLALAALLACFGLVSCQPKEGPAFEMDLQFYDQSGSYIEVPTLIQGEAPTPDLLAINRELSILAEEYRPQLDRLPPDTKCILYPTQVGPYVNLLLWEEGPFHYHNYRDDPSLTAWVYHREEGRRVTMDEALALMGTDYETIISDLYTYLEEERNLAYYINTAVRKVELLAFRMVSPQEAQFYFYVQENLSLNLLYVYDSQGFRPLEGPPVPLEDCFPLEEPLWHQWQEEGQPQGGFTPHVLDQWRRGLMMARETIGDYADIYRCSYHYQSLSQIGDQSLAAVTVTGLSHAAGSQHLLLGVWDESAKTLQAPVYDCDGDHSRFTTWEEADGLHILCTNSYTGSGWESNFTPRYYRFDENGLHPLTTLPSSARSTDILLPTDEEFFNKDEYWYDRLSIAAPHGLELFERNPNWGLTPLEQVDGAQWSYLGYLSFTPEGEAMKPAIEALRAHLEGLNTDPYVTADWISRHQTVENGYRFATSSYGPEDPITWYAVTSENGIWTVTPDVGP